MFRTNLTKALILMALVSPAAGARAAEHDNVGAGHIHEHASTQVVDDGVTQSVGYIVWVKAYDRWRGLGPFNYYDACGVLQQAIKQGFQAYIATQ